MDTNVDLHDNADHRRVIEKMERYEDKIMPVLDERAAGEGLPDELARARDVVAAGDATLGDYVALADALRFYGDLFTERDRSHFAAYRELVQELFEMDEGLATPNAYDPL